MLAGWHAQNTRAESTNVKGRRFFPHCATAPITKKLDASDFFGCPYGRLRKKNLGHALLRYACSRALLHWLSRLVLWKNVQQALHSIQPQV